MLFDSLSGFLYNLLKLVFKFVEFVSVVLGILSKDG
jgi:hypothetical protein